MKVRKRTKSKPIKAGTSKAAAEQRKQLFVEAFIENGGNASQAAITAGYSEKSATQQGARLLTDVNLLARIKSRRGEALNIAGLATERTLKEVARLAFSTASKLCREDGTMRTLAELDEDTAAAVARFEVNESKVDGKLVVTTKVWFWDKNAALEKAMKHLGLYERDNEQKGDTVIAALLTQIHAQDTGFPIKH